MTETPAEAWQRCRPWIEAALATCPTHDIDDIRAGIEAGQFQFWPAERCAAITEIATYPRLKALHHWLCGGDLKALLHQVQHIEVWAKAIGCQAIFGSSGRPVLGRILAKRGYQRGQIEYMKEL